MKIPQRKIKRIVQPKKKADALRLRYSREKSSPGQSRTLWILLIVIAISVVAVGVHSSLQTSSSDRSISSERSE